MAGYLNVVQHCLYPSIAHGGCLLVFPFSMSLWTARPWWGLRCNLEKTEERKCLGPRMTVMLSWSVKHRKKVFVLYHQELGPTDMTSHGQHVSKYRLSHRMLVISCAASMWIPVKKKKKLRAGIKCLFVQKPVHFCCQWWKPKHKYSYVKATIMMFRQKFSGKALSFMHKYWRNFIFLCSLSQEETSSIFIYSLCK